MMTFVVTHTILPDPVRTHRTWLGSLGLAHNVAPILSIGGWLLFGPRNIFKWWFIPPAMAYGAVYDVIMLVRGAMVNWYPYAFLDPRRIGYTGVLRNIVGFTIVFAMFAAVFVSVDRWSTRKRDVGVPVGT